MKGIAIDSTALWLKRLGKTYQTGIFRYAVELAKRLSHCPNYRLHYVDRHDPLFDHYDLYHSLFHAYPPPRSLHQKTQTLITFHDLIAWLYPELFPLGSQELKKVHHYLKGNWFLAPSEATKRDLMEHFAIENQRIFVTPLAACPRLFYPNTSTHFFEKYQIPQQPYFLFVGRMEERKGVHDLLKTFYTLIEQENIKDLNLVLCGPMTASYSEIFQALCQERNTTQARVFHIPFADNEDLSAIYSHALSFVFLSRYEGFGLPLLEAMQCATPPICFDHSSHPEVVGQGGILAPNQDLDFIAHQMLRLYQKPDELKILSKQALEQSRAFSWDQTLDKTLQAYEKILLVDE